ncbi:hypothetical protein Cgig2_024039 [Carnegiea gigantea]|uniref:Uncharacterized protein n=1 Tax=Carnegiea gigantea TaxID=171969 RepID=A0A9Q1KK77_9CARY|nr:hypothetical protein Cgig2_024039 [Carnegiea gigantea]
MVKEITRSDILEQKIWYSLKYDRQMLMALEGHMYMSMIFKGNDEHGYLYGGNEGPMRRAQKGVIVCEGRVETSDDRMVWWEDELHIYGGSTTRPYVNGPRPCPLPLTRTCDRYIENVVEDNQRISYSVPRHTMIDAVASTYAVYHSHECGVPGYAVQV